MGLTKAGDIIIDGDGFVYVSTSNIYALQDRIRLVISREINNNGKDGKVLQELLERLEKESLL